MTQSKLPIEDLTLDELEGRNEHVYTEVWQTPSMSGEVTELADNLLFIKFQNFHSLKVTAPIQSDYRIFWVDAPTGPKVSDDGVVDGMQDMWLVPELKPNVVSCNEPSVVVIPCMSGILNTLGLLDYARRHFYITSMGNSAHFGANPYGVADVF